MADPNNIKAYNRLVAAAKKAGSPDPHLTASIAMQESGWMKSKFAKQNNPFGQTIYDSQIGKKGIVSGRPAADGLLTAEYDSLDSALNHHMAKWGDYYIGNNPQETLSNLVKEGYNTVDPKWADKIYSIHTGPTTRKAKSASAPTQEFVNLLPEMVVTARDPNRDIVDFEKSNIMDDLAYTESLNNTNYFAQGGVHNMNKMNKRYYAEGGVDPSLPLNVRRNNPGNLRPNSMKNANDWWGEGAVTSISDGGFAIFNTPEDGIRALKQQLRIDGIDRGMTIKELIYKFAPPDDDNPTDAYAANMAKALGLEVDDKISKDQLDDFAAAIIIQEGGSGSLNHYEDVLPESSVRNARLSFNVDTTTDNIARANGEPTAQDINNELFGGFESAAEQQAATDAYYARGNQADIIDAIDPVSNIAPVRQDPEDFQTSIPLEDMTAEDYARVMPGFLPATVQNSQDFQTQGTPEEEAAWYAKNTNQAGIIDQLVRNYAAQQPPQNPEDFQTSTPLNELTAEDYARLGINSDGIANFLADQHESSLEPDFPTRKANMLEEPAIARDAEIEAERAASAADYTPEEIEAYNREKGVGEFIREEVRPFVGPPEAASRMATATGNLDNPDVRPKEGGEGRKPNLNNMDYTGLLSSLGTYATRMLPLAQAFRDAGSWDEESYPSYAPVLPTAKASKQAAQDAFTTAKDAALQQGRLDLGMLSALASQQAKSVSGIEEAVGNKRAEILNQAQMVNNQTMTQAKIDTAGNKGAALTMQYQILNDMGKAGEMSMREYNMQRNDANVKNMFTQVFGDEFGQYLKDKNNIT